MRTIPLTRGLSATVDDEDFAFLSQSKWYAQPADRTFYAARRARDADGKSRLILMHRVVNGTPDGVRTDHRDCDGLNNVRANLRDATAVQSVMNRRPYQGGTSPLKGVWKDDAGRRKPWRSAIRLAGKIHYLGRFVTAEEGHRAYALAAAKHFGEFARTSGESS